jgi:predicted nucleotide-binding protein
MLFAQTSLEGTKQRYMLPDFLWKLAADENGYDDYESDEEVVDKQRQTTVSELGWVTNNRRNF